MEEECISNNIKLLRKKYNLTQQELANQLSVSRSVVAKWENNHVKPDISSLLKIAKTFDISLDHLAGNYSFREDLLKDFKRIYASKPQSFDEEIVELIEYIMTSPSLKEELFRLKKLPPRKQQSIHKLLADLITQYELI